jgi:hypothetical protein
MIGANRQGRKESLAGLTRAVAPSRVSAVRPLRVVLSRACRAYVRLFPAQKFDPHSASLTLPRNFGALRQRALYRDFAESWCNDAHEFAANRGHVTPQPTR